MNEHIQLSFRALADGSRRDMLKMLAKQDMTIGEISTHFKFTRAAVKKHLTILEDADLISVHPQGRERYNRLNPQNLKAAAQWFEFFDQYWDEKLAKLKSAIEKDVQ